MGFVAVEVLVADPFDVEQRAAVLDALPVMSLSSVVDCRHTKCPVRYTSSALLKYVFYSDSLIMVLMHISIISFFVACCFDLCNYLIISVVSDFLCGIGCSENESDIELGERIFHVERRIAQPCNTYVFNPSK
jgi:hypothetical protein